MNNEPCGGRSKPWLSKTSCVDPSQQDSIYKKLPEKSTSVRTLCKRVPCLFRYALRHSLGGVHDTCSAPSIAPTKFFKSIETKVSKTITTLHQNFVK